MRETILNPHYRKSVGLLAESDPQHESSKSKQLSMACISSDSEQCEDERECVIPCTIDTTQMKSIEKQNLISVNMTLSDSETYEECIQLSKNVAYSQTRVWSKKQEGLPVEEYESSTSLHCEYEYDEVLRGPSDLDQKKPDGTMRCPSPEYAEIVSKDKYQKAEIEEQHYYHSPDVHYDTEYYSSIADVMVCTAEVEHNNPPVASHPLTDHGISIVGVHNMSHGQNDLAVIRETA